VTFVAATLLLGERVSAIVVIGGAIVILSVVVSQYAPEGRVKGAVPEEGG
jgi:drug/metabolite transporter (DMT)-like permease